MRDIGAFRRFQNGPNCLSTRGAGIAIQPVLNSAGSCRQSSWRTPARLRCAPRQSIPVRYRGLYDVDRGFTMTIAAEAAAWEAALDQRGQPVRSLIEAQLSAYDYLVDLATKAEPI